MKQPTVVGLDLAKQVFQVHGIDADGTVVVRKKLRRSDVIAFFNKFGPCLIGIEACGTAHYWGRELVAIGHEVRLMPAGYVKPYVKRGKNDEVDAEAICEAVTRPTMRFVPIKPAEQQAILMLHRTRDQHGAPAHITTLRLTVTSFRHHANASIFLLIAAAV